MESLLEFKNKYDIDFEIVINKNTVERITICKKANNISIITHHLLFIRFGDTNHIPLYYLIYAQSYK